MLKHNLKSTLTDHSSSMKKHIAHNIDPSPQMKGILYQSWGAFSAQCRCRGNSNHCLLSPPRSGELAVPAFYLRQVGSTKAPRVLGSLNNICHSWHANKIWNMFTLKSHCTRAASYLKVNAKSIHVEVLLKAAGLSSENTLKHFTQ